MAEMHEFNLESSREELAEGIVRLPDGFDFSKTNLFGTFLIAKDPSVRDPRKYAEIFYLATKHPGVSSWMKFACLAEVINGVRRVKGSNMSMLVSELDVLVERANNELPNGDNKYIFLGTCFYNMGIIRRGLRQYWEAAKDQRHASAWYGLAGNVEKQFVCLFVAAVEETTAEFVGGDSEKIIESIGGMIFLHGYIKQAVTPYPDWMKQNANIHIGWAYCMSLLFDRIITFDNGNGFFQSDEFNDWKENAPAQWAKVPYLMELFEKEKYAEAVEQNAVAIQSSSADNAGLTVKIFVALAYGELGKKAKSKKILTEVMNHAGPDGGIPIAVATRLLEE